jgi:hypothetical protein
MAKLTFENRITSCYVMSVVFLMPIDWFTPTGTLLREFGAKPATMLLVMGGLIGLVLPKNESVSTSAGPRLWIATATAVLALLGSAFAINCALNWSGLHYRKDPATQFMSHFAMIASFFVAVVGNARLLRNHITGEALSRYIAAAALLHGLIFVLEALGVLDGGRYPLSLFRGPDGPGDRPSGLTSEPAYFGTLAALYAGPLWLAATRYHRSRLYVVLAGALLCGAVSIYAKTTVAVLAIETLAVVGYRLYRRVWHVVVVGVVSALASVWLIVTRNAFDVGENLSSAMRLGSTLLSLKVAAAGYGLVGIGAGQFHYFYREEFAPSFLFGSEEAINQFHRGILTRASTYNLWTRLLVEGGALSLALFCAALFRTASEARRSAAPAGGYAVLLIAGSVGFLMTQDTYCYPPLVVGLALGVAAWSPSALTPVEPALR